MADTGFAIGNVVIPKSGGMPMTVESIDAEKAAIECVWFDQNNREQHGTFKPEQLRKVG